MQTILVKQHVLEALSTQEEVKQDESSSNEEEDSEDDVQTPEKSDQGKEEELLFTNGDDLGFDDDSQTLASAPKINDDVDLLLDNFYNKMNEPTSQASNQSVQDHFTQQQIEQLQYKPKKQLLHSPELPEEFRNSNQSSEFRVEAVPIEEPKVKMNQEQARELIKNEINSQAESLQERLRMRKQNQLLKKQQDQGNSPTRTTHTLVPATFSQLQSPNLSNISPSNDPKQIQPAISPLNKESMNNSREDDLTDNMILRNLEEASDIDAYGQEEEDEDPETLQEIERRKEEIMEEFLEIAYQKKHEAVEEAKNECKKLKLKRDEEKKKVTEVQGAMDKLRKDGMNEIKKKLNLILNNDSISGQDKLARLNDTEQIRAFMLAYFSPPQQEEPATANET